MIVALGVLGAICLVQQFHIHKLINKLMSTSFYDYQISKKAVKSNVVSTEKQNDFTLPQDESGYLGM